MKFELFFSDKCQKLSLSMESIGEFKQDVPLANLDSRKTFFQHNDPLNFSLSGGPGRGT